MSKKQLKVLVACEESQRVTQSFRDLDHEAYSCDLIECSGGHLEWHIKQDVVPLLNGHCTFNTCDGKSHTIYSKWDLIIAHPPCTYFSTAGACRLFKSGKLNEERYQKGLVMKDLFLKILNADCEHIMIENPTPMKIWKLPPPQ
jgi:site-specific DNA-cytosine methylase